jgi:putative flippase GtrA
VDRGLAMLDSVTGGHADWFQRLFSYLFIGGCAAIVNLICFVMVYYHILRTTSDPTRYLIAFTVATEISILANFIPNDYLTFRHLPGHARSWGARCLRFHVTCIGGTLVTLIISSSLLHLLHAPAILAQAVALIIATTFNFTFHHIFTYRQVHRAVS